MKLNFTPLQTKFLLLERYREIEGFAAIEATNVNLCEFDTRLEPRPIRDYDDKKTLSLEERIKVELLKLNGEFIEIFVRHNPLKVVKIRSKLPEDMKDELIRCLKTNTNLFFWSAEEMPNIDLR